MIISKIVQVNISFEFVLCTFSRKVSRMYFQNNHRIVSNVTESIKVFISSLSIFVSFCSKIDIKSNIGITIKS